MEIEETDLEKKGKSLTSRKNQELEKDTEKSLTQKYYYYPYLGSFISCRDSQRVTTISLLEEARLRKKTIRETQTRTYEINSS